MKITAGFFYKTFFNDLNKQLEDMYKAQRQLSTGKRVLIPSDDPIAISRITKFNSQLDALSEYSRVIDTARTFNATIETAINDLKGMVTKAKQYAIQGSTDTLSPTDRLAIARELDTLIQRSLDTINTEVSGRYVFSGFKGNISPVNEATGVYRTDTNIQYVDINFFLDVAINLPATDFFTYTASGTLRDLKVFTPYNRTVYTDSLGNDQTMTHDADPLGALLMRQPSGGAITDPTTPFTLNGGTLRIKFSDRPSVEISIPVNASLNDIRDAINSANASVKAWVVNTGTDASPDYRLVVGSIPNGKSNMIRIEVDGVAGDNLNLLAYEPERGIASMSLEGNIPGYNYITDPTNQYYYSFNNNYLNENYYIRAFYFLKVALENNDQGRIQKAVEYLDKVADNLYRMQSIIGARLNKLENVTDFNLELSTNVKQNLSNDQDADAVKVVSEMTQKMTVLQALRTTFTDFFRNTLFDFLR